MSRVEQLEKQIAELDPSELKIFREWFERYNAEMWDRQIESDAKTGKVSGLAERALRDYEAGHTTEL